jgi:hypothetical protein
MLDLVMPPPDGYDVLAAARDELRTAICPSWCSPRSTGRRRDRAPSRWAPTTSSASPSAPVELVIARIRGQLRMHEYVDPLAQASATRRSSSSSPRPSPRPSIFRDILFTVVRASPRSRGRSLQHRARARQGRRGLRGRGERRSSSCAICPSTSRNTPRSSKVMETGEPLFISDAKHPPALRRRARGPPQRRVSRRSRSCRSVRRQAAGRALLRGPQPLACASTSCRWRARWRARRPSRCATRAWLPELRKSDAADHGGALEAERRLRALERYADFFHSAADGIVVVDADWHVMSSATRGPRDHSATRRGRAGGSASSTVLVDAHDRPSSRPGDAASRGRFPPCPRPHAPEAHAHGAGEKTHLLSVSFSSSCARRAAPSLVSFRDVTAERATATELRQDEGLPRARHRELGRRHHLRRLQGQRAALQPRRGALSTATPRRRSWAAQRARPLPAGAAEQHHAPHPLGRSGGPGRLEGYRTEVLDKAGAGCRCCSPRR